MIVIFPESSQTFTWRGSQNEVFICRNFAFYITKRLFPTEVKSRKTKENGISRLWDNALSYQKSRILSRILCLGGKSILKIFFVPRSGEKSFFRPSRGVWGYAAPKNFERIVFRIDLKLHFWTLVAFTDPLISSSNENI